MNKYGFDKMVGNVTTISLLKRSLNNNSFPQFSIFSGVYGTGKSTNAKNVAMTLTCDEPINGCACGKCKTCLANESAFETIGESSTVKIVNIGSMATRADVSELIKNVFVLKSSLANKVYIFEEAHALAEIPGAETAFLEEIDRMPPNTYVIMCTTKDTKIIEELRSRAMTFTFGRLTNLESERLVQIEATSKGVMQMPPEIVRLIVSVSRGIPRELKKATDFVLDNGVTIDELKEHLQKISDSSFIELFSCMKDRNIATMLEPLDAMCNSRSNSIIISEMKNFVIRAVFLLSGGISDGFTAEESMLLQRTMNEKQVYALARLLESHSKGSSDADLKLLMLHIRAILQDRAMSDIVANQTKVAALETVRANNAAREVNAAATEIAATNAKLTKLSARELTAFSERSD